MGYAYDEINNLTQLVEDIDGVERTTSYTYDDDNRTTSVTTDGITVEYTYDAFGRVTQQVTKLKGETAEQDQVILTEYFTFTEPSAAATSGQVATYRTVSAGLDITYSYTYDANGNILTVSDGTNVTGYTYDTANQLVREDNQQEGKTYTWTYDAGGNITAYKTYAYSPNIADLSEVQPTSAVPYVYSTAEWKDLLVSYNGKTIEYDTNGNPDHIGDRTFTWQHGRQLATLTENNTTWNYTYNNAGLRTGRYVVNGASYKYVYNGSQLVQMTVNGQKVTFTYDAAGTPLTMKVYTETEENGTAVTNCDTYYYITNLQGDVMGLTNSTGSLVVSYEYSAYGVMTVTTGATTTAATLNPLTYRGYVYDSETELYYLQSRYYDPEIGRFINADVLVATGQGLTGNNMFAYCLNNPVNGCDPCGTCFHRWDIWNDCENCGGQTIKDKLIDYYENGLTLNGSVGIYGSVNLGVFNVTGSVELAVDLKGNIQIIGSGSFDVTTAGNLSASGGATASLYVMPDTSYYAGDTYYMGGSVAVPNPACPAVAVGVGGNVGKTSDGYWGINGSLGVGTATAAGAEGHVGYSKTKALTEQFNIFEWIVSLF